jgi:hypothetical protein
VVPVPPGIVIVTVPEAFVVAVTPVPTKFSNTAFEVSRLPSSDAANTATKQLASVGPQGCTNSAPGSMVAPMVKGLVRGAAKAALDRASDMNTLTRKLQRMN